MTPVALRRSSAHHPHAVDPGIAGATLVPRRDLAGDRQAHEEEERDGNQRVLWFHRPSHQLVGTTTDPYSAANVQDVPSFVNVPESGTDTGGGGGGGGTTGPHV